jgi:YVTN family beta-propeller protein
VRSPPLVSGAAGHFLLAVVITPHGKTAYVADFGSGTVSPIRTATDTVGKAITVARAAERSGPADQ